MCIDSLRSAPIVLFLAGSLLSAGAVAAQEPAPPMPAELTANDTSRVSARGALLRSLALPGWGQSYVGAPGRGALYFALEAGSLWMTFKTTRALRDARELESWLRATDRLAEEEVLGLVESREEQREDWIALSLFWILASGADAYVSAQLADFDEHVGVRPTPGGGVQLEARVPLGSRR